MNQTRQLPDATDLPETLSKSLSEALQDASKYDHIPEARIINVSSQLSIDESELQFRLHLMQKLQTTLELNELLMIFFREIQQLITIDGLSYRYDLADINISIAEHSTHSFNYNLATPNELVGSLTISRSTRFRATELDSLHSLLDSLIYPLKNALNYRDALNAATRDPLTATGNRIALNSALQHEIEVTKRYNQSMAVLMLDMDNFKYINEMFGHTRGDEVLISVAETMKEDLRSSDSVFRYSGEEFVILLGNTNLERATQVAERLRRKIEALTLEEDGVRIITTTSIGMTMLDKMDTIPTLLERTSLAKNEAGRGGRNQFTIYLRPQ